MEKITAEEMAEYIINSPAIMYEDGEYFAHWNYKKGLNYDGIGDPENITVSVTCDYAEGIDSEAFYGKESLNDPDFMWICETLAEKMNDEIEELFALTKFSDDDPVLVEYFSSKSRSVECNVDYMRAEVDDVILYAEAEPVKGESYGKYEELKAEIIRQAEENGIDTGKLRFWFD